MNKRFLLWWRRHIVAEWCDVHDGIHKIGFRCPPEPQEFLMNICPACRQGVHACADTTTEPCFCPRCIAYEESDPWK